MGRMGGMGRTSGMGRTAGTRCSPDPDDRGGNDVRNACTRLRAVEPGAGKPADVRLPDRACVSARFQSVHAGAAVSGRRTVRGDRAGRPIVDPQGRSRDRQGPAAPRRAAAAFWRGHHRLEERPHRADLADARRVRLRPRHVRAEETVRVSGRGWGLTQDATSLIMSDGSDELRILDPVTFNERRRIKVTAMGSPLRNLNELEYVKGEIFANVWQTDYIARIAPATGKVSAYIDLRGLLTPAERAATDVLNGIAYDAGHDRLFVTGKWWPKLFEIKLVPR